MSRELGSSLNSDCHR